MADVSTQKKYLDLDGLTRFKTKADGRFLRIDGGNGTQSGVNALLNKLPVPSSTPADGTYVITSGTSGLTDFYRRPVSMIWDYVKSKDGSGSGLDADTVDGVQAANLSYATIGNIKVGETKANITTAQFIERLRQLGALSRKHYVIKCGWTYAQNDIITDTGCGDIQLAGAVVEVFNEGTSRFIRVTTSPAATDGAVTNAIFVYRDNGSSYSPNWKRLVNSTDKLNADTVDGIHANGLLTGVSLTGANKNTLSATVGGVTKTACITPHTAYGSRYFFKTDNGGRTTFLLIADITALNSTTSGGSSYGFTGRVTMSRSAGGATNGCEHGVDVTCRASYSSSTSRDLNTSNDERILPVAVTYQGKTYLALRLYGSGCDMVLTGWWRNCLETFTELLTPSGSTVPEGVVLLDSGKVGAKYTAAAAVKLRTTRSLWGQTFNGEGNVSGSLTGVGGISASGEIRTAQGSSTAAFRAYTSAYGAMQRIDSTHYWFLLTNKDDPQGGFNSLRPLSIVLATGTVTLGNGALTALHGGNVGFGMSAPAHRVDVAGAVRASTGFICSRANSGSALHVAQNSTYAMLQATNGYGNNYMAVTKTYGENGVFIQSQNGRYGYEFAYMKKTDIDAGNNNVLSMFRLDEDGTVTLGSYNDLGTERMDKFMTVYRTMRLYRKSGVAVDVKCNADNELEVSNAVSVKEKLTLRSASGKRVELTVSETGSLLVNGSPVTVAIKV